MKYVILLLSAAIAFPFAARADEASHHQAAETLLEVMGVEEALDEIIEETLAIQMRQNPMLGEIREELRGFFRKCMSWESLKEDYIALYVETFTEEELKELATFYKTPVGRKAMEAMPELFRKGAAIGERKVQEHMPELMAIIEQSPSMRRAREANTARICVNNLRQIDGAKDQWALEHNKTTGAKPTASDIDPYLYRGFKGLTCPAGGTYTIHAVGENPECSVHGDYLGGPSQRPGW